jgi:hypothetical protein
MGLGDLLDQVRQYYLDRFIAFAKEKRANKRASLLLEPVLRDRNGAAAVEGELQLGYREDLAVLENGAIREMFSLDTEGMLSFEPLRFDWGENLEVCLRRFQWQCMSLRVPQRKRANWLPLQNWFWRWFRQHEDADDRNLLGAVHSLSDPELSGKTSRWTWDRLPSRPSKSCSTPSPRPGPSGVRLVRWTNRQPYGHRSARGPSARRGSPDPADGLTDGCWRFTW